MSPVVSICPVHGPFESRLLHAENSTNVTISGSTEPCQRCGRTSRVMEGIFDFDSHGIATALAAPAWSIDALRALQEPLRAASTVLSSPSTSDEQAQRIGERVVEMLAVRDANAAAEVAEQTRGKSRAKIAAVCMGILLAIGYAVDVLDAGERAVDLGTVVIEAFQSLD